MWYSWTSTPNYACDRPQGLDTVVVLLGDKVAVLLGGPRRMVFTRSRSGITATSWKQHSSITGRTKKNGILMHQIWICNHSTSWRQSSSITRRTKKNAIHLIQIGNHTGWRQSSSITKRMGEPRRIVFTRSRSGTTQAGDKVAVLPRGPRRMVFTRSGLGTTATSWRQSSSITGRTTMNGIHWIWIRNHSHQLS